jgi:hypothetical protein
MALGRAMTEYPAMQVLQAQAIRRPGSRRGIAISLAIGVLLLALGGALGYLAVATPFAERLIPEGRVGTLSMIGSALGWTLLLVAPTLAGIAGITRLAGVAGRVAAFRARPHPVVGLSRVLGEEFAAATGLRLPDGRIVSEIIVGPHGIAVFEPLPPLALIRVHAGAWQLRIGKDRWVPLENPLDRTVRSADRVRRWIAAADRDFVVKVHAAVIAPDVSTIARTPACAVITRDQVPAYLASLPAQRTFTAERRAQVLEHFRATV